MSNQIYRRWYATENRSLVISANFSHASSTIWYAWARKGETPSVDDFSPTPYQVADARHRPSRAFSLVRSWEG